MPEMGQDLEETADHLRYTAEVRRFNSFIEAARRLECDETGRLFKQAFHRLISANRNRTDAAAASRERIAASRVDINALDSGALDNAALDNAALDSAALGRIENR